MVVRGSRVNTKVLFSNAAQPQENAGRRGESGDVHHPITISLAIPLMLWVAMRL
jgi:hypothetical protein